MVATQELERQAKTLGDFILREQDGRVYRWAGSPMWVAQILSKSTLAWLYLEFERQGVLPIIFHEGVPGIDWFLDRYSRITTIGCFLDCDGGPRLVGMGWINEVVQYGSYRKAEVGEGFVRHPPLEARPIVYGRLMASYAFERLGLSYLYGTTPEPNRAANIFRRRLGFKEFGPIPGYTLYDGEVTGVYISVLSAADWRKLLEQEA